MTEPTIDIYPVGVLAALKSRRWARIRQEASHLAGWAHQGRWRTIRSAFNGYLAEVNYPPEGLRHTRCGRGWTKRAAASSLGRNLYADNRGQ